MPRLSVPGLLRHDWRPLWAICLLSWLWLAPAAAHAASDQRVESSSTLLELDPDGGALVRHELLLAVRGGVWSTLTLRGVDPDAEPLADGSIARISDGPEQSQAQPLDVHAAGETLELSVPGTRLRGGRFLLKFAYRTRLLERGAIRPLKDRDLFELSWLGPRFDDGVDSVTLLVRAHAAPHAPELAPRRDGETYGMVMSTLRRSRDNDELELVRTHIARDEAMRWSVLLDRGVFEAATPTVGSAPEPAASAPPPAAPLPVPRRALGIAAVLGLGLV